MGVDGDADTRSLTGNINPDISCTRLALFKTSFTLKSSKVFIPRERPKKTPVNRCFFGPVHIYIYAMEGRPQHGQFLRSRDTICSTREREATEHLTQVCIDLAPIDIGNSPRSED